LNDGFSQQFDRRNGNRLFLDQFNVDGQLRGRSPMIQSLYLWTRSILPNYILLTDRLEMAHSIETRLPFLDHHLFEYVRDMPDGLLIRSGKEKYLLREAAKPYITETVYERRKHPFTAPQALLSVDNPLYELMQDTLRGKAFRELPFFDADVVTGLLDNLPALPDRQRMTLDPPLMMMLCASILQSNYGVQPGSP